jgi:alpha-L-fucosidase
MKLMKYVMMLVLAGQLAAVAQEASSPDPYATETKEQRDARMGWWREAKFGMFIHWGVYSVPAGTYNGKQIGGIGEWIMNRGKIPCAEYQAYAKQFNPVKYDPDAWVRLAKRAGMKYMVITSKHHDGFTLYPSAVTNWGIGITPYGKDVLKPLAQACRGQGMKLGFYYSQAQDWNNGGAGNGWDPANQRSMDEYIAQVAVPQVKEILTGYGEFPAILWWDTPHNMNAERAKPLIDLLKLKPGIIHNNRLGGGFKGDTETPEQHIPATGFKDRDWEVCMTMNDTWGFKSYDQNWKPVDDLIQKLCDIASKGGNFLLNVGPTAEGEIPQPSIERLEAVGRWMDVNGESIYGTVASPFHKLPWGRCTRKVRDGATTLYLHVFDWPKDGKLPVTGLKSKIKSASLLAGGAELKAVAGGDGVTVMLPETAPDKAASVVKLEIDGALDVEAITLVQEKDGKIGLDVNYAELNNPGYGAHMKVQPQGGKSNLGFWTDARAWVQWTFTVSKPGAFVVSTEVAGPDKSAFQWGVDGKMASAAIEPTGQYDAFKPIELGRIAIDAAGTHRLAIKPVAEGWKPVNVRAVTLTPVPEPTTK